MPEVKSSGIAIVMSFFWTGLGQLYAGSIGVGLAMMLATPVIWAIGFIGGLSGLFTGGLGALGGLVATDPTSGVSAGEAAMVGGVGVVGIVVGLLPVGWWVWGMLDAKKRCEVHNASTSGDTSLAS